MDLSAEGRVSPQDVSTSDARIREFMEAVPPVVSFVGKKKAEKPLLVRVVTEMVARGYRVAIIKHDQHGFDADVPARIRTDFVRLVLS